jgi:hypothetical protein
MYAKTILFSAFLSIVLISPNGFSQEKKYAIIAHPDQSESQIAKSDLKSIFLGRKKQWDDGSRIVLGLHPDKTAFKAFSRSILSKTVRQYMMYWRRMIMTGRGSMPKQFRTTADAVTFVAKTKGAVAIVVNTADITGVARLTVK